jgi:hypothetical protein
LGSGLDGLNEHGIVAGKIDKKKRKELKPTRRLKGGGFM